MTLELPCYIGDTVYAFLPSAPPKEGRHANRNTKAVKRGIEHLTECVISEISICDYSPEPVFTAINREKAEYGCYWLSDFGTEIFTKEQYWTKALKKQ